jgi:hypothetical protein
MSWRKPRTGSNQPCSVSPQVVVAFRNKACPAGHRGGICLQTERRLTLALWTALERRANRPSPPANRGRLSQSPRRLVWSLSIELT